MNALNPIEIVGGGLAGLSLGLALRREDIPVCIMEAGDYPRHRVCGEFIAGLGPATIARLGLGPFLADARQHHEVAWYIGGEPMRVQRLPAPALGLSRHTLDDRLADAFVAAGGDLRCHTRAASPANLPGRVIATGRQLGRSPWLGLKFHVAGLALASDLEVHLGKDAYIGVAGIEDGRVNVCGLFRRRADVRARGAALLPAYLRATGLGQLAERVDRASVCTASFSAVAALGFARRIDATDGLKLGDACAMIPPFTGNGMAMAFQGAELAVKPLVAYARGQADWSATCRTIHTALHRRFRMRLASAGALHPFLLRTSRQRFVALLTRARLLPFGSLYAVLH